MAYRKQIHYTNARKAEMWDRSQRGETLHSIARLFDRHHSAVRRIRAAGGAVRAHARRRSPRVLMLDERLQISRAIVAGQGPEP